MKNTQRISGIILVALMLAFSANIFAQPNFHHRRGGKRGGMFKHGFGGIERFADELGLSDKQIKKLKALKFETAKEAVADRSEVKIAHIELRELFHADTPNESAIKKQIEKIGRLKTDMMLAMVDKKLAVKKILTDEQQDKLKELKKARFNHFKRGDRKGQQGFGFNGDELENPFFGGLDENDHFDPPEEQEL